MLSELVQFDIYFLKQIIKHASAVESVFVCIGIIVGGIWTYLVFIRQRLHYPKLKLNLEIRSMDIGNSKTLVHAEVYIDNVGSSLLKSNFAELRLRQILPIVNTTLLSTVENGLDPVPTNQTQIQWPCIVQRSWEKKFEIEPGEPDTLHADFFVDDNIQIAEFYFFLQNSKKKKGFGWCLTKNHYFSKEKQMDIEKIRTLTEQQERQQTQEQKQQQQQSTQTQQQQKPAENQSKK